MRHPKSNSARDLLGGIVAVSLSFAADSFAQCSYDITLVSQPAAWSTMSITDMNSSEVVVGAFKPSAFSSNPAYRWDGLNGFVMLAAPPGIYEWRADRINDFGMVAGHGKLSGIGDTYEQIIVWSPSGEAMLVPPPTPIHGYEIKAMTNTGVVGGYTNTGVPELLPFQWKDGRFLPQPPGIAGLHVTVNDLTSDGRFGGSWVDAKWTVGGAYLADPRGITSVEAPTGFSQPNFRALNRLGHAVLIAKVPPQIYHTFLWVDGAMTDLGVWPGMTTCYVSDMNDLDQVVGACSYSSPPNYGAMGFLWQSGTMHDVAALAAVPPGMTNNGPMRILDDGRMLVVATSAFNVPSIGIMSPITDPEDVTVDCKVDMHDLQYVLNQWDQLPNTQFVARMLTATAWSGHLILARCLERGRRGRADVRVLRGARNRSVPRPQQHRESSASNDAVVAEVRKATAALAPRAKQDREIGAIHVAIAERKSLSVAVRFAGARSVVRPKLKNDKTSGARRNDVDRGRDCTRASASQ